MLELVPVLARFTPPAALIDKHVYSPWFETDLHQHLQKQGVTTLIISGAKRMCVFSPLFWVRLIWDIGWSWRKMPSAVRPTKPMMPRLICITGAMSSD